MATKAELEAQLAKRDEDRPTVHAAVAGPAIATGCLLMTAVLYLAAQRTAGSEGTFSPNWLAIPVLVAWVIAFFTARTFLTPRLYGSGPVEAAQALAAVAGGTAAVWLVWTGRVGPGVTWPFLCMWWGIVTLWWSAILWTADRRLISDVPVVVTGETVDQGMPWARFLEQSTGGRVALTGVTYHRAGAKLTVEPARVTDEGGAEYDEDVTFDDFAACANRFASLAAKEYRRRHPGEKLPVNCARPEEGQDDAEFVLHVTMRDVFSEHADFVPSAGPQDIRTPKDLGEYEDATRILLTLFGKHGKIVGATGSGKSVEANNWIARITECSNALVWVCATDKLIPLIFPWLKSWFAGRAPQPVLDWSAGLHVDRVLVMLAAAYKLCCERNARLTDESAMTPTEREPAVFVIVEEMSHMMEFKNTIVTHDGIEADASTLIMMIARAGRSAGVQVVLMSQTALNSAAGDCAAEIVRNLTIRVCLLTLESHDGWRTITALNGVDTTKLPHNTKIVQPSREIPRAMPGKAAFLDGTCTVEAVAMRNAAWRPVGGVEPESDLGFEYQDRWNPRRHPELARAVAKHGLRWRIPDALIGAEAPPITETLTKETDMKWTGKDEAAAAAAYAATHDSGEGTQRRASKTFHVPGGDEALAKLQALAQDLVDNPPEWDWKPPGEEVGEEPNRLPSTLDAIIGWFDKEEESGTLADFYLTEEIAAGIRHPDQHRLGREIWRDVRIRSRRALKSEDEQQRRGYDTRVLRETAKRYQHGL